MWVDIFYPTNVTSDENGRVNMVCSFHSLADMQPEMKPPLPIGGRQVVH